MRRKPELRRGHEARLAIFRSYATESRHSTRCCFEAESDCDVPCGAGCAEGPTGATCARRRARTSARGLKSGFTAGMIGPA